METSLFARLSPELRNRIYEFAFEDKYSDYKTRFPVERHSFNRTVGLTQTCRQIRSETLSMFYVNKSIDMELSRQSDVVNLCNLLEDLGSEIVGNLHDVRIYVHACGFFPMATSIDFVFNEILGHPMRAADDHPAPLGMLNDWGCQAQTRIFEKLEKMHVRVAYISIRG